MERNHSAAAVVVVVVAVEVVVAGMAVLEASSLASRSS